MSHHILTKHLFTSVLLIVAALAPTTVTKSQPDARIAQPVVAARVAAEPFLRTELFFGADRPDGSEIGKDEFRRFLKEEITPRFPAGLTVLTGTGQFRDAEKRKIIREKSMVLILLYAAESAQESDRQIEQIRAAYKARFQQQSVLRVDDPRPVLVSF